MSYSFENTTKNTTNNQINKEQVQGHALNWGDTLNKDAEEFVILPAGDYQFRVVGFERQRFEGSEKMPACPKALLKLKIEHEGETVEIQHSLLLHTKTEWALASFFSSIGLKKEGQPLVMNWNLVPGSTGRCQLVVGKSENGNEFNRVKKFYKPINE